MLFFSFQDFQKILFPLFNMFKLKFTLYIAKVIIWSGLAIVVSVINIFSSTRISIKRAQKEIFHSDLNTKFTRD